MIPRLLHELLDRRAAATPDAPALARDDLRWTYADLARRSRTLSAWLGGKGVGRGDRVLVAAPHDPDTVALLYAVSRLGAAYVVVSDRIRPFHLDHILADSEPELVLAADAAAETVSRSTAKVHKLSELPATGDAEVPASPATGVDILSLIYTSGSTAMPKAVVSTHEQVLFAVSAIAERLGYRAEDRVFCCLPLSFDYGLYQVFLAAEAGACLVLGDDAAAGPALLSTVEREGVTVLPLVPGLGATLARLAARAGRFPAALRLVTNTGAALPASLSARLREFSPGLDVVAMYGLTECKRVSIEEPNAYLDRPGSVGRPLPGTEVLVLDDDGAELPPGEVGQFAVRGPNVMAGYWRAPEQTARRFPRDAYGRATLLTGDRGRVDEEGYLYFEGRDDDQYKQDGFRVSAVEVEGAAADVDGVTEAAVLPPAGDRPAVLAVTGTLDPGQLREGLAERLEPHKIPDRIEVVDALPHGVNGKIDKRALEAAL
ncbi:MULTISPECIES: class I adenylate-forming enzyme family protein [unclassified Amycolatopsis]|uniref:class I adenylate-forming enzyme family protein n=1 Tax=unclassified Amycolatopsis TaxID=2618356 RepID=UPI0028758A8F|nr:MULTISPECIES: class I adenylate-forming enzyme family protein [unclassified Amycolatopsis]MDS0140040.1 acyl--CoA ligase [Amycolatopsis sp. 505]MDS0146941.1 acyl--CoA ligase [Amycolatopsis sp. CM201R]